MIRGIYAAASGMRAELEASEVSANNLANAGTTGFRRGRVAQRAFREDLTSAAGLAGATGVRVRGGETTDSAQLDLRAGPVQQTGSPLDLALSGSGMFVVSTPQGERLTRAGAFTVDATGRLVTAAGDPALSDAGPLIVGSGDVVVTEQGAVRVNGQAAGRLRIVEPAPGAQVEAVGGGLLRCATTQASPTTVVRQGYLEGANVRAVEELAALMRGARAYDANAQALRVQDEALGELVRAGSEA